MQTLARQFQAQARPSDPQSLPISRRTPSCWPTGKSAPLYAREANRLARCPPARPE
ncbi:hypothetical protein ACU4GD_41485 [Cupriavidus basilensis]